MTTIEEYKKVGGVFGDEKMNKRIISLARRHEFYLKQIQSVVKSEGWSMTPKPYLIFVAKKQVRKDYKIVGFAIVSWGMMFSNHDERFATSLEYWLVDEAFQNQGIGKQLYQKVVDLSVEFSSQNLKVMFKTDNERLLNLYTKLGFKPIEKYDGIVQKIEEGAHTTWWKIVWEKVNWMGTEIELVK
jgi:ribosomal protein S18 acetylase RimI-like enzyme